MNFRNESSYHTAALRKITVATMRALGRPTGWPKRARVEEGRTRLRVGFIVEPNKTGELLTVFVPKLRGDEFVPLLRQQHGERRFYDPAVPYNETWEGALTAPRFAKALERALADYIHHNPNWFSSSTWDVHPDVQKELKKAKVPLYVPLRVKKPAKEKGPRNIRLERYHRILELERRWQTKLKLAQTKIKKLRQKRRHYEKKLNVQEEA